MEDNRKDQISKTHIIPKTDILPKTDIMPEIEINNNNIIIPDLAKKYVNRSNGGNLHARNLKLFSSHNETIMQRNSNFHNEKVLKYKEHKT